MTRRWGDDLFLAIAHPARREILDALLDHEELGATELATRIGASASSLSQHLAVLKGVSLVEDRKVGRNVYYRLTPEPLLEIIAWMQGFEARWRGRLDALGAYLEHQREAKGGEGSRDEKTRHPKTSARSARKE